jgi:3-hydroxyisobutyrate dehydrogenase-like beta-hydroxyacid dehydrogenase
MKVAVLGIGRMGAAMAGRLRGAGMDVTVHNRTTVTAEEVAGRIGAAVARTPREAVAAAEVTIASLADDAALQATYEGDDGVIAGVRPGTVVCDTSTVDPRTVRRLAPLVAERGGALLDAPVSGSVPVVEQGALTVMVGGDAATLERARPALETFATTIFHLGDSGAGATMKLVVNSVVASLNAAISEALVLAEKAGLDRAAAYDVLQAGAVGAPFVAYKRPAFLRPDETPPAFSIELMAKDLGLIHALAESVGATMPQSDTNRAVAAAAVAAGMGDRDLSALAEHLRRAQRTGGQT